MYSVKEIYLTLQGEGAQAGRVAVFLRFAGCNLWNGLEKSREKAVCKFCDTQFVGIDGENGGKYKNPTALAYKVNEVWGKRGNERLVVITGGESLLQLDRQVVDKLHGYGFEVAVETNGTISAEKLELDWICVSPKADSKIIQTWGNELKLVYPQDENKPEDFQDMSFGHFFLSPKNDPHGGLDKESTQAAIQYCLEHPQWRLSLQTHKITGIK